jgi:hypothetical protein
MKDEGLLPNKLYDMAMKKLRESFNRCPKSKYRKIPDTQEQCTFIRRFVENECK